VTTVKKLLLTLMILGAVGSTVGAGTFASFNASSSNPTSTFTTGSIVLGNQEGNSTVCFSNTIGTSTDTNDNASCDELINVSAWKPGADTDVDLTLSNAGTIGGTLQGYSATACANANVTGAVFNGAGFPCSAVLVMIQEYTSALNRANDVFTGGKCLFGGNQGAQQCSFSASKTLADYNTSASPLDLGTFAAGASRYIRIYLSLPSDANNDIQGRKGTFEMTWNLVQ
jgi:predicted ribosomally synthesized peptide with SipW-like signal peptide